MDQTHFFYLWKKQKREKLYSIDHCAVQQGSRSPVGNQVGIDKIVIGTRFDSNGNDQGTKNGITKQIYGPGISPKTYSLKTMAKNSEIIDQWKEL